jgi:trypsin
MRRALLLLASMALTVLLASGVAQAIINGEPDGNQHPYVGWASTEEWACSGTLISPTVFLTAGHCTELFEQGDSQVYVTFEPEADFLPVELDPDGVFDPGDAFTGTPYTHPRFNFPFYDIGVVVLDQPVTHVGYGTLPEAGTLDSFATGELLTAVGYGVRNFDVGGGPPSIGDLGTRYRATVEFLGVVGPSGDLYIKLRQASAGRGGEGTCIGDSGGPYLLPGQTTVVAVTSFGTNPRCAGVGYAQRVDLPEVLTWLEEFL